jgi:Rieske Fe-S protein
MTEAELKALGPGDIVMAAGGEQAVVITANYGDRVTAVRTFDLTNPSEWVVVRKVKTDLGCGRTPPNVNSGGRR